MAYALAPLYLFDTRHTPERQFPGPSTVCLQLGPTKSLHRSATLTLGPLVYLNGSIGRTPQGAVFFCRTAAAGSKPQQPAETGSGPSAELIRQITPANPRPVFRPSSGLDGTKVRPI